MRTIAPNVSMPLETSLLTSALRQENISSNKTGGLHSLIPIITSSLLDQILVKQPFHFLKQS